MQFDVTGTNTIAVGEFTATRFFYQSGPTTNQLVSIDFFLDADRNPCNSNGFLAGSIGIPNTGTNAVYAVDGSVFASRNVAPGVYAVYARSTFGANTRYIYAPQLLRVVPTSPPRFARIRRINGGQMELLVEARPGQRVVLEASSGFTNWSPIATNTVTSSPFVVVDTAPGQRQRFYRAIAE